MCCSWPCFYRARTVILALLSLCDAIGLFFRIFVFTSTILLGKEPITFINVVDINERIAIAFLLDLLSSIIAALMGVMIVVFVLLSTCFCCLACVYACCRRSPSRAGRDARDSQGDFKALHRFISLDCNCPCYRARPKLRFRLRAVLLFLLLLTRGAAIYLYHSVSETDRRGRTNFYACLASSVFLLGTFLLDLYHYGVWWCYTPQTDARWHCRSRKHKRYLPHHIVGNTNRKNLIGDRECSAPDCRNRHLSHVVVFHSSGYQPQPRWSIAHATYIGFHVTTPAAVASIVHSEFKASEQGMLGKGVYFARSRAGAGEKARSTGGACIIAEIRMGKVFEFDKQSIYPTLRQNTADWTKREFVRNGTWRDEYDTCYMNHEHESKDEFCIKDPEWQIIKWVAMVDAEHDAKVRQYGLDTELESTKCHCI